MSAVSSAQPSDSARAIFDGSLAERFQRSSRVRSKGRRMPWREMPRRLHRSSAVHASQGPIREAATAADASTAITYRPAPPPRRSRVGPDRCQGRAGCRAARRCALGATTLRTVLPLPARPTLDRDGQPLQELDNLVGHVSEVERPRAVSCRRSSCGMHAGVTRSIWLEDPWRRSVSRRLRSAPRCRPVAGPEAPRPGSPDPSSHRSREAPWRGGRPRRRTLRP